MTDWWFEPALVTRPKNMLVITNHSVWFFDTAMEAIAHRNIRFMMADQTEIW